MPEIPPNAYPYLNARDATEAKIERVLVTNGGFIDGGGRFARQRLVVRVKAAELDHESNLGLSGESCAMIGRKYGPNSDAWVGKELRLAVVPYEIDGKTVQGIHAEPVE